MDKRITVYLHDHVEDSEIEEVYPDAFEGVPESEHENVRLAIHNISYEYRVDAVVDTTTGKYRVV